MLLPLTGLGVLACLSLAVALAVAAIVVTERRRTRRLARQAAAPGDAPARAERGPMSAPAAVGLTLLVVAVLAYVVLVVRAA